MDYWWNSQGKGFEKIKIYVTVGPKVIPSPLVVRIWLFGPYNCTKQGVYAILPVYILLWFCGVLQSKYLFVDFLLKNSIFDIYNYDFLTSWTDSRIRIYIDPEIYLMKLLPRPLLPKLGKYIRILKWFLDVVRVHFICQSHEYEHSILIPFSIIRKLGPKSI